MTRPAYARAMAVDYDQVASAVEPTGMILRGGFVVDDPVDGLDRAATVLVVGNAGGAMWPRFRREETPGPNPLDRWTREVLGPIADRFGATFVHPSDEPFRPFQRWATRADDVWPSPIGLLIHPEYGLWHAYRGAFVFADRVDGLPAVGAADQPCLTCRDRPCLSACPVDAFATGDDDHVAYDHVACRAHVRSGAEPACATLGCASRLACPVSVGFRYGPDQMAFHMRAFTSE